MLFCLALLAVVATATATADTMQLYTVSKNAQCMDGSPAAYYHRPSKNASSTLWLIFLQGGGACHDKQSCTARSKTALGSSSGYADSLDLQEPTFSSDPAVNPDFYNAHMVYVPYCSSDTHTGQNMEASADTWNFYFSGHSNLVAIVDDLRRSTAPAAWAAMQRMLLTGGSAGGVGTINNADWLTSVLPSSVIVKAAPIAGWFFPGNFPDQIAAGRAWEGPSLFPDFAAGVTTASANQSAFISELWQTHVSPDCTAAQKPGEEYKCFTAHVAYHYVKTPLFIMENNYDSNQLTAQGKLPQNQYTSEEGKKYIAYFGRGMRNSTSTLKPGDGIFLSSCLAHGAGLGVGGESAIQNVTSGTMLGDWFWGRPGHYVARDTCDAANGDLPCNPTCPGVPSGDCGKELEKDCPAASASTPAECDKCGQAHRADLEAAGCTTAIVQAACKDRSPAGDW